MATAGRPESDAPAASDAAALLTGADVVRLVGARTGDGLAATVLLARAIQATGVPFQARLAPLASEGLPAAEAGDEVRVAVGRPDLEADLTLDDEAASLRAGEIARELADCESALALAGALASAGSVAEAATNDLPEEAGEHRPGVGVPTADPVAGLVHSTLLHGPVSGSEERVEEFLGQAEDDRELASLVALDTVEAATPTWAATAVERLCNPRRGGPLETIEGYGDALNAVAVTDPGSGMAALLGDPEPVALLPTWRDHGRRAHAAVRDAPRRRHDGLVVVDCQAAAPLSTVARLVRDFVSPEPVVLALGDGEAVATSRPDAADLNAVAEAVTSAGAGDDVRAAGTANRARFVATDGDELTDAVREAL